MLRLLAFQLLVWGAYGAVHFAASIPAVQSGELRMLAVVRVVKAVSGLLVSSVAAAALARWAGPEYRAPWSTGTVVVLVAGAAWMLLDRVVLVSLAPLIGGTIPWSSVPRGLDLEYWFVMCAWTAGFVGLALAERSRELRERLLQREIDAQEARLQALATKLNPHFLFNTLNMIRARTAEDPAAARDMLTRLSDLLRRVLAADTTVPIPLREEVAFIEDYLAIQRGRFESALDATVVVSPDAEAVLVPPLILQPLVENAMKFGTQDAEGILRVRIEAGMHRGALCITVENPGTLDSADAGTGVGLALTRKRLHAMYGVDHRFTTLEDAGVVRVELRLGRQP